MLNTDECSQAVLKFYWSKGTIEVRDSSHAAATNSDS